MSTCCWIEQKQALEIQKMSQSSYKNTHTDEHVIYLVFLWLMVSFLLIHKFDIEAGSGDRCSSFKSPEYLSKMKTKNDIRRCAQIKMCWACLSWSNLLLLSGQPYLAEAFVFVGNRIRIRRSHQPFDQTMFANIDNNRICEQVFW